MGKYTVVNDDCFEYMKKIPNNSIDFVLTDPPYLFIRHGGLTPGTEGNSRFGNSKLYAFGSKMMSEMSDFDKDKIYKLLDDCDRVLKVFRGYFFCNESAIPYYMLWASEHNYNYSLITLEKDLSVVNRNRYSTNAEYIVRIYEYDSNKATLNKLDYGTDGNDINWLSSVQYFGKIKDKYHPTEKPLDIIEGIIKLNTKEGDIVLDPFMGSGPVGVVCNMFNRRYIGIEIDKQFFDIAEQRIENMM